MAISSLGAALVAGAASAAASFFIVGSQRWHGKHTLDHDLQGVQKFHTAAVPRVGGIALVMAILLALVVCYWNAGAWMSDTGIATAGLLLIASLPTFLAGILEDVTKKVSVKTRLAASVLSAILASWLLGAIIDKLNIWGLDALLTSIPVALIVTAGTVAGGVNAINIIDGFNGLASSTVVIMLGALGAIALQVGDTTVAQMAFLGMAAALGFVLVNYPTGRLFLGDGGAYFLGFWVAEIIVLLLVRDDAVNAWQLLSVCAYPIIEVSFTIYRRKFVRKTNPGMPDGLHLHTLVYRRLVPRFVKRDQTRPWKRNAAVACLISPWTAFFAWMTVSFAQSVTNGVILVLAQVMFYLVVYQRLVRGRWIPSSAAAELINDGPTAGTL